MTVLIGCISKNQFTTTKRRTSSPPQFSNNVHLKLYSWSPVYKHKTQRQVWIYRSHRLTGIVSSHLLPNVIFPRYSSIQISMVLPPLHTNGFTYLSRSVMSITDCPELEMTKTG